MFTYSTPGMQPATDSGWSKNLQTVPTGSATTNSSCSFISRPFPGRPLTQAASRRTGRSQGGEYPAYVDRHEMAPVLCGRPNVGGRVSDLERRLGGGGDRLVWQPGTADGGAGGRGQHRLIRDTAEADPDAGPGAVGLAVTHGHRAHHGEVVMTAALLGEGGVARAAGKDDLG